jgi:phospholipid/cholesterol/gamma-HCH transport system ATP-binding protein
MLHLDALELGFGDAPPVLAGLQVTLAAGAAVGIIGAPSTGKSVLLKAIAGLVPPRGGRLVIDGVDLARADATAQRAHRKKVGMLFQNTALFDSLTIFENVAFPLRRATPPPPEDELTRRVQAALDAVGLPKAGPLMPHALSGGMQKRAGIARATVARPRVRLFDEPTAGLDPVTAARILVLINTLHAQDPDGVTLVVSNEMDSLLAAFPRIWMLAGGGLHYDGASADLVARRAPRDVLAFVRGELDLADEETA